MEEYSSNFVKGSAMFAAGYLLAKALARISKVNSIESCLASTSSSSRFYSEVCTVSMGALGSGLLFSVLFSKD